MFRVISSTTLCLAVAFSTSAGAGDCSKTVMGGGCTVEGAGVAPHMRAQTQPQPSKPNVTAAASAKSTVKVSATAQKPKI